MNAQQFLTWMRSVRTPSENPGQTSREESAQLDALLDSFPYFQSGHLLYIKNLHTQGSFLYNNQLKTAAAYAVNRKVLYQLITLKSGDGKRETGVQSAVKQSSLDSARDDKQATVEQSSAFDYAPSDNLPETKPGVESKEEKQTTSEEQISVPPQFPPKKFTSNPDEWEAGMLRQLQLLHHWQQTGDERWESGVQLEGQQSNTQQSALDSARKDKQSTVEQLDSQQSERLQLKEEVPQEEKAVEQQVPDAKEEINTLLYVLVEPGQSEDIAEDAAEELSMETVSEENETTQWEIKIAEEENTHSETPIAVPSDLVQKEIMVEAIHSTFELEVDDRIPSINELQPNNRTTEQPENLQLGSQQSTVEQSDSQQSEEKAAEEVLVTGMEMSFSQWLQEVGKPEADKSESNKPEVGKSESEKAKADQPQAEKTDAAKKTHSELPKTALSTDLLVEQFIKDEPRINVKKSGFYNPVNMAKKSVQESDEFITETLARIYAKQGNTVKAVRAYQKLSLKFPEKTAYFAALIEELKRTPNK